MILLEGKVCVRGIVTAFESCVDSRDFCIGAPGGRREPE